MASLPNYVAAAKPVPQDARQAWYKNTAQTYAGIMLWFVFWQEIVAGDGATPGGTLASGLGIALLGILLAALFCHFLTYLVPGLLGMKTGLPLYVVGTSTYGVRGGFIMPGFLMGALQFGWLAVNAFFSCWAICRCFNIGTDAFGEVIVPGPIHGIMTTVFIVLAVGVGLKGIQYVAKVATFVPLIPLAILVLLLIKTAGGIGASPVDWKATAETAVTVKTKAVEDAKARVESAEGELDKKKAEKELESAEKRLETAQTIRGNAPLGGGKVLLFLSLYVVGFFATAGAAGTDFGMNNRNARDVQLGGLVGIVGATFFAAAIAALVIAGAYGGGMVSEANMGELNPVKLMGDPNILGEQTANWMLLLLALASFAPACFPAFIAANSFRTTMPNVNPWFTVGLGTLAAIGLAVTGVAGQAVDVFKVVGASFGPICGAMLADYLLAGRKWPGPRAAFNLAGWISWAAGFTVGAVDLVGSKVAALSFLQIGVPCPPMAALIVGFMLYIILAKMGLEGETLKMPEKASK